jgi:hypothetical protein
MFLFTDSKMDTENEKIPDFWTDTPLLRMIVYITIIIILILGVYIYTVSVDGTSGWFGVCIECEKGTYMSEYAATACISCAPGTYADKIGTHECKPCPNGTYTNKAGSKECNKCEDSQVSNYTRTSCTTCPPGRYSDSNDICVECPVNTYNPKFNVIGIGSCRPCTVGKTTLDKTGVDTVDLCL